MSLLAQIKSGRAQLPPRLLVYGTEGVGKSTLAAGLPGTVFVSTEDGLDEIDCAKWPVARSLDEVMRRLESLVTDDHTYQTVAIDTLDWLERLVWDFLCKKETASSIEKVGGGYGKGYALAVDYWRDLIDLLARLRNERQMAVVLVAHAKVERFEDPEAPAYDRYSPRLHKHASALITEWCDAVLFATRKFRTQTEEAGFNRTRAIAQPIGKDGGERVLRCVGGPSCVAKNRYGLPAELPLDASVLLAGIANSQSTHLSAA